MIYQTTIDKLNKDFEKDYVLNGSSLGIEVTILVETPYMKHLPYRFEKIAAKEDVLKVKVINYSIRNFVP